MKIKLIVTVTLFLIAQSGWALDRSISVIGRAEVTTTKDYVQLGDVSDISALTGENDEAIIGLKRIWIATSPKPNEASLIQGEQIVEKLREQGVNLNSISYSFPQNIRVKRAGREILPNEIKSAIEEYLSANKKDMAVKEVKLLKPTYVSPGDLTLEIASDIPVNAFTRTFAIEAGVDGKSTTRFNVDSIIEEFRKIPVARRQVSKGSVISEGDIEMARMNIATLPHDATEDLSKLYGFEATQDISSGEVFRISKIALPLLVEAGSKVTLKFESGLLEATASGIALEGGSLGQSIKVRNESSKKTLVGEVVDSGIVRVR